MEDLALGIRRLIYLARIGDSRLMLIGQRRSSTPAHDLSGAGRLIASSYAILGPSEAIE